MESARTENELSALGYIPDKRHGLQRTRENLAEATFELNVQEPFRENRIPAGESLCVKTPRV